MAKNPQRPNSPKANTPKVVNTQSVTTTEAILSIDLKMQQDFDKLAKNGGLQNYKISQLVEDSEDLGELLFRKKLKTNQIRKFLDNIKRFKVEFARNKKDFDANKDQLNILRYHLAYLAARQAKNDDPGPVEPLKKVLESAIKGVNELEDFERLVQLIEAIIAYHKAAGGSNQ